MKAIKILLKAVLWIVVLVIVALLALPLWFGPVVKCVANSAVPKVVGTDFHLGHLSLNPYTARFELGDMQLYNPTGYSEKFAVTVGDIAFDAETLSLATDVIHVEEIKVKDIFVSYVNGGENKVNNFQQIQYNVAGGKEKYEQAQAEKKEAEQLALENAEPQPDAKGETEAPAEEKSEKKVIIDRLSISGVVIQWGFLPIRVPVDLTLTDIGRKSGGATVMEVWDQVLASILKAAGVAGDQLKALGGLVGDAAGQATEAVGKAAGQATEALNGAAGAVGDATGKATEAVGDAASKATESVGNATKAVGDGAKKALDTLNSLW